MTQLHFLQTIVEASPFELKSLLVNSEDSEIALYGQVLELYRMGKIETLSNLISEISDPLILALANLRLQIRTRQISLARFSDLEREVKSFEEMWHGEIYFVLAMAAEVLDDQRKSQSLFLKSYTAFEGLGFSKKAVKALLNATACESRIYPDGKFIPDYQFILQKALEVNENSVACIALTNISREYQKLGSLNVALEYCDRALVFMKSETGTQQYDLIIAQRAHLLLDLQRLHEAEICFEHLRTSSFPEAVEAMNVLLNRQTNAENLLPTWKERLEDATPLAFSCLEEVLMEYLCESARTREEIIKKLYGDKADYAALENRFFNLVNRVNRKHQGLIYKNKNSYGLSDRSFLVSLRLAK